jgi:hypothetical protein
LVITNPHDLVGAGRTLKEIGIVMMPIVAVRPARR